ncbi:MAG: glycosyl transferase family 1 [Thermoleophilia bacterium]|nr:glycosyl transferase family 1 [Thermoleophilia bacterium]
MAASEHRSPRVALLTTSWPRDERDATGRFLAVQVEQLRAAGMQVEIVGPRQPGLAGFNAVGLSGDGGIVANAKRRPWRLPLLLWNMAWAIRHAARRSGGADVVHANWLLTAPLAAFAGKPVVLTLHGSGTAGRFDDLGLAARHPRLFRWLIRRAAVVTAVSAPLADAARAAGARHVVEIPHGVEVPRARTRGNEEDSSGEPIVLVAGRLSPEKGVAVLAAAWPKVHGARLSVAGDGSERHLLAPIADELHGFVTHGRLQELYAAADLMVMPSLSEGFGVTALEAMAAGIPVVASRVGGLAGLVEHEVTGLLVPPSDPEALAAALQRLIDDSNLRKTLGAAARRRAADRYGWQRVVTLWRDAYASAANPGGA